MSRVGRNTTGELADAGITVETIIESIPDAVLIADTDTLRIVDVNAAAAELFECDPADLVGRHFTELHPADPDDRYEEAFQRALEDQRVNRLHDDSPMYIKTPRGTHKPVEINASPIDDDHRNLVLGVFRDATNQIDRERNLRETRSRLETLLDATPLPVAVLDTDGTVELWNKAAEETFGYPSEAVIGDRYPLFVDDTEFGDLVGRVLDDGILDGYETVHRANDGSLVPVELYVRPLFEDGTITGLVGAAIDISDRERRNRRLDVLHRVLRHNIRNQLTVIRGYADEIAASDDRYADTAAEVVDASDMLLQLSEKAHQTREVVEAADRTSEEVPFAEVVTTVVSKLPVTEAASPPEQPVRVPAKADRAVRVLLRAVGAHYDGDGLRVAVESNPRYVEIAVGGETQLLPEGELEFLRTGEETALNHGQWLEVAQASLLLSAIGGEVSVPESAPSGSQLAVQFPRVDAEETADTT